MQSMHASPDLNLLAALDSLLVERSVTRAAARLGITQSAMSHKLARLRTLFGDPLLVGGRSGMTATPEAEKIGRAIKPALAELRSAMRSVEPFDPKTSTRRFVMVTPDYAAFSFLPRALGLIGAYGGTTRLAVREPWPGMVDALRDGSLDLIAGSDVEPASGLIRTKLFQDELVCIVRRDHPRVGRVLDLETFLALPHLLVTRNPDGTSALDDALAARGLARDIAMRVPYHLAAPFIVARSDLVALTTRALARDAASLLPLRIVRCPFPLPLLKVTIVWHERNQNDPAHQWLRELTMQSAKESDDAKASKRRRPHVRAKKD
jgi:DNA-binding transcriptional LysR family regulator